MEEKYNGPYAQRLNEIDKRIEQLENHRTIWGRAGAGTLSMQADEEINCLKEEKNRILNGTQEEYEKIESKIEELKRLRNQCSFINFIKKNKLTKEINSYETKKIK